MEIVDRLVDKADLDIPAETLWTLYATMLRIRKFEEKVVELYPEQGMKCPCHLSIGQEAVAAGLCANLRLDDYVFGTHRGHAFHIAKGGDLKAMMAELYGKKTGCSRGKGGSMHLVEPEVGNMGTTAIVGGNIPLAVGAALASVMLGNGRVAVALFGDGATDEGVFYESLSFAALKRLPVVFVCENNFYATHSHQMKRQPVDNIYQRGVPLQVPGTRVDGTDVVAVYKAVRTAVERARQGAGPSLLECRVYRWKEHVGPDFDYDLGYRSKEELDEWMQRCPTENYRTFLLNHDFMSVEEMEQIAVRLDAEIEEAVAFAKASPFPGEGELFLHVYN